MVKSTRKIRSKTQAASEPEAAQASGLRDRKKIEQRLQLVEIAVKLFQKHGYESARMEDIAALAKVSTKTVYNYFPTKRDILIEYLLADREQTIPRFQTIVDTATGDLITDLLRLMEADVGYPISAGERSLWLEIMAVTVRERGDERFRTYRLMLTSYIETILRHLQRGGKLSSDLDIELAARIVHTLHSENFEHLCTVKSLAIEEALQMAKTQLDMLFRGWTAGQPPDASAP